MTDYVELQVRTNFSFLEGASHPHEHVSRAAELGHPAIAITDRNSLAGVVRAHVAAKEAGIRLVVGAQIDLRDGCSLLAYPTDRAAYGRLCRLITTGRRRAPKGECELYRRDVLAYGEGVIFVACAPGEPGQDFADELAQWSNAFPGSVYLAASHRYDGDDQSRLEKLADIAVACDAPLVATNDVIMHVRTRRPLADVLTCIREKRTIDEAGYRLQKNAERHLKGARAMTRLFRNHESALYRTLEIAERCTFSLDHLTYDYPDEVGDEDHTPQQKLEHLVWEGARWRYPAGTPDKVSSQIEHELTLIDELRIAPYFLTVHDLVQFARSRDILCQGRGSAANSIVCYVLGITAIDPARLDLLFERFVSPERNEPPDIDVDFEHERREEVIQYVYNKYGRDHASLTATVIHYRARRAIREVGKALGLSLDTVSALASQTWGWSSDGIDDSQVREIGLDPSDRRLRLALDLTHELIGSPRHLSQHVGGFVITRDRLDEIVPVENATMKDRTVIEWDKDDLDALKILKVDVLALGMLTCLRKGFALLHGWYGKRYNLGNVLAEDPAVYDMLCKADTLGVFQVESRAQMTFLPRMQPRKFYDLVIEVAIVRPGPIQGDMVHPYLRRRDGKEQPDYPSEELRGVLGKTLGVPLFQEQAMRIAVVAAGFTPAEADRLRRAMATFRKVGTIGTFREKMIQGMAARGYDPAFAERCFRQIEGFGEYGFPESHAASFALLVYDSAWMKCHYPAVFACALLNSQPLGFYAPAQIVRDAREHGVEIRPPDVNRSNWDCTLEPGPGNDPALRLGFRQIKGFAQDDADWLATARGNGYTDINALWRRAGLSPAALATLAHADAFESLALNRRQAMWEIEALRAPPLPLFAAVGEEDRGPEPFVQLPAMSAGEEVVEDYSSLRLSLKAHPVTLLRNKLAGVTPAADLIEVQNDRTVTVCGLVLVRQRPGSAKGVIFITLEDDTGTANIIVWTNVFEAFRRTILTARLLKVKGTLQREGTVIHVVANALDDLSYQLDHLGDGQSFNQAYTYADAVKHPHSPDPRDPEPRKPTRTAPRPNHPRQQANILFPSRDFH